MIAFVSLALLLVAGGVSCESDPLAGFTPLKSSPWNGPKTSLAIQDGDSDSIGLQDFEDRESRFIERRNRYPCPSLMYKLLNGMVRVGRNVRMVRFLCNDGFELVGSRTATCIRGRWNRAVPNCVSNACSPISDQPPLKVKKVPNYNGSVVDLECELGYVLEFNITKSSKSSISPWLMSDDSQPKTTTLTHNPYERVRVYCLGKAWYMDDNTNRDFFGSSSDKVAISHPQCETQVNKSMNCTFETDNCGWLQDSEDNFDWLRNRHATPSFLDGTGPTYDHTLGVNKSGYYLYLESSYPREPNDKALLYSPVYVHNSTPPVACFEFWYHMYGRAIGSLRVYIKEREQSFVQLTPLWELVGDQGQNWTQVQLQITPSAVNATRPFQIIFEGVVGYGHQGDIGIDDFSLKLGEKCANFNDSEPGLLTPADSMDSFNGTDDESSTASSIYPSWNVTTSTLFPPNFRLFSEVVKEWIATKVKSRTQPNATTSTTPLPVYSTSSKNSIDFDDLHQKLKAATEKQTERLKELNATSSWTTPLPATNNNATMIDWKTNGSVAGHVVPSSDNEHNITSDKIASDSGEWKISSTWRSIGVVLTIILALALLCLMFNSQGLFITRNSNAAETSNVVGINNAVATFVRRCKMLRGPNNFGRRQEDGEMLIIGDGGGGGADEDATSDNSTTINGNSNNHFVYDNFTDSAVFLQPNRASN